MALSEEQVRHVANRVRLDLADDEIARMTQELDAIVGYVEQLQEVDVDGVEPRRPGHRPGQRQARRPARRHVQQRRGPRQRPQAKQDAFLVPKAVEQPSPPPWRQRPHRGRGRPGPGRSRARRRHPRLSRQRPRLRRRTGRGRRAASALLLKDNIHRGHETAVEDPGRLRAALATVVDAAGAVIIGNTNMDEFAMGSSNETSCHGPVKNPVAGDRIPGARAAAPRSAPVVSLALGSDTADPSASQPLAARWASPHLRPRQPLRPGRLRQLLDQIGLLCTDVADAALTLNVTPTTAPARRARPSRWSSVTPPRPCRVTPKACSRRSPPPSRRPRPRSSRPAPTGRGGPAGREARGRHLPHHRHRRGLTNLSRYDGVHYGMRSDKATDQEVYTKTRAEGFGAEVKRRIMLGTHQRHFDAYHKLPPSALMPRLRRGLRRLRRHPRPDQPDHGLQGRREADRSPADVPLRHLHDSANPAGVSAICRLRPGRRGSAHSMQLQAPQFAENELLNLAAGLGAARA